MKLIDLVICGLPGYPTETRVPLDELGDASVVCVTGPNGSGKTTWMEAPVGAAFRTMPSRGMLADGCTEPKSFVRAVYDVGGKRVEIEVNISGTTGKIVSRKFDVDPTVPFAERSIKSLAEFTAAVAKHLPSREVYLSSAFGASNKAGSFLNLEAAERRTLLAQLIGIEKWQERSDAAKDRAKALQSDLDVLKGKIAALEASGTVGDVELATAKDAVQTAMDAESLAEHSHEVQRKLVEEWSAAVAEIDAKVAAATTEKARAEKAAVEIAGRVTALRTERTTLDAKLSNRDLYEERAAQECEDPAEIEREVRAEMEVEGKYATVKNEYDRAKTARDHAILSAQTDLAKSKEQAAMLGNVECKAQFEQCEFLQEAIEHRDAIPANEEALATAQASPELTEPQPPGTKGPKELEARLPAIRERAAGIATAKIALAGMEAAAQRINAVACQITVEEENGKKADARMQSAHDMSEQAGASREAHQERKPAYPDAFAVKTARTALQGKRDELARLEERKRLADEAAVTLKDTRETIAAKTTDLDDWATLRDACGPKGIQAYLIDAAAPELSAICNDILHECYGSRFTVRLATQAAAAKKGKTLEICDITVLDNERGTDCSASVKSTGEQALLNEALSLAGVVYNNRNSDIPMRDIFRDECTTGLDMANGPLYIGMLRKAAAMCEARIFPVLHLPSLWDLCDARLHVEGGKVEVR